MKFKQVCFLIGFILCTTIETTWAQADSCQIRSENFTELREKVYGIKTNNRDSLLFYSNLFSSKFTKFIKTHPSTLNCDFRKLTKNRGMGITTNTNGTVRIYSWNTWLGGTMNFYNNLFQFKVNNTVYTKQFEYGERDAGTFFTDIYTFKTNNRTYVLALSAGSLSTRYYYKMISAYTINGNRLDEAKIFRTENNLKAHLSFEYDISNFIAKSMKSVPEIKYYPEQKILIFPVKNKTGSSPTLKFINDFEHYEFTETYFDRIEGQ